MAHPGSSGKRAVKRLCVYVYMAILFSAMHSVIVLYFPSKLLTSTMSFECRMSVCGACQQSAVVPQRGGHCRSSQGCTRGPGSWQCIPLSHTRLRCRLPHDAWANILTHARTHTHTHTHTFNGPLSRTTRVSQYQKGETNLDFTEARDSEWQWHQLGHMQVCTSLQTDNHASTPPLSYLQAGCLSCRRTNQSTEGNVLICIYSSLFV